MDGFYIPFNSISVISGWWKGEHERLCAMKRHLGFGRNLASSVIQTRDAVVGSAKDLATRMLHTKVYK